MDIDKQNSFKMVPAPDEYGSSIAPQINQDLDACNDDQETYLIRAWRGVCLKHQPNASLAGEVERMDDGLELKD